MTRQQKQYAREQRALLRLRRAAVRWSEVLDEAPVELETELQAACDAYATVITAKERRRLLK